MGENPPFVLFNFISKGLHISEETDLLDCFLNLLLPNVAENNSVNLKWIHTQQIISTELATKAPNHPKQYFNKHVDDHVIVCHAIPDEDCLS